MFNHIRLGDGLYPLLISGFSLYMFFAFTPEGRVILNDALTGRPAGSSHVLG